MDWLYHQNKHLTFSKSSLGIMQSNKDNTSVDKIDGFLLEALRTAKDRTFVLKIEHTVLLFMADTEYAFGLYISFPLDPLNLNFHR